MQHHNQKQHTPRLWLLTTLGSTLLTLLIISGILWAQSVGAITLGVINAPTTTTTTIPYQGRLTDSSSNPVSEPQSMIFRLYNQAEGGTELWKESRGGEDSVLVENGLFNVMLGSVDPLEQSVITENNILYLGITIGTNPEMSPRVQLGAVPYAVHALSVADGSITSSKVRLEHGRISANFETPTIALPTTFTEIDSTRIEISLGSAQTLIVFGIFDFHMGDGTIAAGRLSVDGELTGESAVLSNARGTVGQTWLVNLSEGTHTLFLVGRRASAGGTASVVKTHTTMTWFSFAQ